MLKFLFWSLLLANTGLAAYQLGYLDTLLPNGREPVRLERQLHPERLRLLPAPPPESPKPASAPESAPDPAAPAAAPAASPTTPTPAEQQPQPAAPSQPPVTQAPAQPGTTSAPAPRIVAACLDIGGFNRDEADRFLRRLGDLAPRAARREVQEAASHMVYVPPQADRAGAEQKAAELRALGVNDFFIIQDNSPLRWGISLGVFKTEDAARNHLAQLNRQGVRSARIGQRTVTATAFVFRLRNLDAAAVQTVEQAGTGFERVYVRECAAA